MIVKIITWTFVAAIIGFGLYTASQPGTGPGWLHGRDRDRGENRYCERHDCQ